MTTPALELFRAHASAALFGKGDKEAVWEALQEAARQWGQAGRHLAAALALEHATHAAGTVHGRFAQTLEQAIAACRLCVNGSDLDALEALAALHLWIQLLGYQGASAVRKVRLELQQELADRLLWVFGEAPEAVAYLIRGVTLEGRLEGDWKAVVPDHVPVAGVRMWSGNVDELAITLPSAFDLLRKLGDQETLWKLVERFPEEFESVTLRGWKHVLEAERSE